MREFGSTIGFTPGLAAELAPIYSTRARCPFGNGTVPKRDQHWQVSNAEAKRLEAGFAQAGEPTRRETDQMPRRRKNIEIHCSQGGLSGTLRADREPGDLCWSPESGDQCP